jgi:triosephosphate isomerase (TIM)
MSVIIANWKMSLSLLEASSLASQISDFHSKEKMESSVILCPSFTSLDRANCVLQGSNVKLGAQDCSEGKGGARTGEVSAAMIKDLGCEYVILGHSERRINAGETDIDIRRKLQIAHMMGLKIILCIGETEEEKSEFLTLETIERQITTIIPEGMVLPENMLIAYEPVWAIGSGATPTPAEVSEIGEFCRGIFATRFSFEKDVKFLYGGSVNVSNCANVLKSRFVDGVLVGGASLKFDSFSKILIIAEELCKQS